MAVTLNCGDPLESGVWVIDRLLGDARQVAVGTAGPPKWSPDGAWLVFGFVPIGTADEMSAWMVKADGTQLREGVDGTAWTPDWLPPG